MKIAMLALAATIAVLPQQTFRSAVNTVEIYATVVDRDGRLVPDLTKDDFQVYDDTRPVKIDVFAAGVQPITMALMVDESPKPCPGEHRVCRQPHADRRIARPAIDRAPVRPARRPTTNGRWDRGRRDCRLCPAAALRCGTPCGVASVSCSVIRNRSGRSW